MNIGVLFLENLNTFDPAFFGHANIHQNDIRCIIFNRGKRIVEPAVRANAQKTGGVVDNPPEAVTNLSVVIDNEYPNDLLLGFLF